MARTLLVVGTRKGLFLLESDDRRAWSLRGPLCESWPVYHAIHDPGSGALYAAAASEWHGSAVWRSRDLGETWTLSSEGLAYGEGDPRRVSKVATLAVAGGRVLAGVEAPGIFASDDGGETWSLLSTLEGQPGSSRWNDPANQPPGHLGVSGLLPDGDDGSKLWAIVQGVGIFETADGTQTWTPRNRGLRADWPRPEEEVGFCVHRLVRSADPSRFYQQNHVGVHRSDDGCRTWTEITDGLPSEFGFAAAAHPHDRDTFYVIPLDPGHARCMPEGRAAVWRTRDGGSSWERLADGLPQEDAHLGVLRAALAIDRQDTPGLYFGTSTGQVYASADEGERWTEIARYLPPIWSVEVATLDA
ncbi:MAG TPA: hypothetical protein VFB35_04010 [Gaiellaceae bacterium]|jgi:photosystem II stability/assembly factor-like uncharacterized protein|nr:hypothetical protein [Gaiellaceae bacterium]